MAGPRPHAPGSPRRHRAGQGSSSVAARTVAARGPAPLFLSLAGDYKGKSSANRKRNRRVIPSPPGSSTAQAPRQSPRARRRGEAQQSVGRDDQPCLVQNAAGTTPGAPPSSWGSRAGKEDEQAFVITLSRRWKATPLGAPLLLLLVWQAAAPAGNQSWLCKGFVQPRGDPHAQAPVQTQMFLHLSGQRSKSGAYLKQSHDEGERGKARWGGSLCLYAESHLD